MLVLDEQVEEIGQIDERFKLVHVVLEIFLAVGLPPVSKGLGAQSQNLADSLESGEVVEDGHDWNVSEL